MNDLQTTRVLEEDECWPPDDYTGFWEIYWGNGKLKSRGQLVDGVQCGIHLCLWEDGTLCQIGYLEGGSSVGLWTDCYPGGMKQLEGNFTDGKRDGTWTSYDRLGTVTAVEKYRAGELIRSV